MNYPIEAGNIILILVGIGLVISGPLIVYKTTQGMIARKKQDPMADMHWFSNGLNFLIAVLFFLAGTLFIVNNLRGNPLS